MVELLLPVRSLERMLLPRGRDLDMENWTWIRHLGSLLEDKGHDQTVFSDGFGTGLNSLTNDVNSPSLLPLRLPSTRLGKKTHSLCFHHDDKVVEKRPSSVLKQEALGIHGRAPERSSLSSVVSSSRRESINQRRGKEVMERVLIGIFHL